AGLLSRFRRKKPEEPAASPPLAVEELEDAAATPGFITRHRRPLLLAAAVVVVSMLALNLALQRMGTSQPPAPQAQLEIEPEPVQPAEEEVSLVRPEPRIIDMIDGTATGSINPGQPMSFVPAPMPAQPAKFSAVDADEDLNLPA